MQNKDLKKRIIEISYKYRLSHIGSCVTAVDIIQEIFKEKVFRESRAGSITRINEPFVLSSGHAGLALYCVIEKYGGRNAEDIFLHHGVHPDRCYECGIDCSSGSLGHGLPIAVGMALADRSKNVYCLISDGECSEGSIWEALRMVEEQKLTNLKIYLNFNGWGAYKKIDEFSDFPVYPRFLNVRGTTVEQFPFLKEQDAHYIIMSKDQYEEAMRMLSS